LFKDYIPPGGPTSVLIGLKVDEITDIDQQAETFSVVGTLQMRWRDPKLGFRPAPTKAAFRVFEAESLPAYARDQGTHSPEFIFFNQQGRRFSQNAGALITSDGKAFYLERFTATLQAPYFHFSKFPFDSQDLYIDIDLLAPEADYILAKLEGYSSLGKLLGLEEWDVSHFDTGISSSNLAMDYDSSRFRFHLYAERKTEYYLLRIFVPMGIIVVISWIIFFLKDYGKRIDIAAGNLLLFIAFNFVIAGDLPRLNYLTFMDAILFTVFAITSFSVVANVFLRRMDASQRGHITHRIDGVVVWAYPLVYLIAVWVVHSVFL
jgi:hypothetical protein